MHELHLLKLLRHHPDLFGSVDRRRPQFFLLSRIKKCKCIEYGFVFLVIFVDLQYFFGHFLRNIVTILAFRKIFPHFILQPIEMFVCDVLNVDPLDFEMSLKLSILVFPPERECLVVVSRYQFGHSFEMPTFHGTEEQQSLNLLVLILTPILLEFVFVSECGRPYAILYGFMDVVIIAAANHQTTTFNIFIISLDLKRFEMRERLYNGWK